MPKEKPISLYPLKPDDVLEAPLKTPPPKGKDQVRTFTKYSKDRDVRVYGNNAAACCPLCQQVFLVSSVIGKNVRRCPNPECGRSTLRFHSSTTLALELSG